MSEASSPPPSLPPRQPNRRRPPTAAEAFFRYGFGCAGGLAFKIAVVVVIVLIADWRAREKYARREAERAEASEIVARVADEFAEDVDSEGRFVRKPEGQLHETDVWGRPIRLAYKPGTLSDGLEVRSAGPDGEWQTRDDVVATRTSRISNRALARDAVGGLLDGVGQRLSGKKAPDAKK
jgi:hypothetical protein